MMVKDELFSKQTMQGAHNEEDIRRIMGMNDVHASPEADIQAQEETCYGKIQVLHGVSHHGLEDPDHTSDSAVRLAEFLK
jgi:hypothetical protein